jgi:hypothetical protein
MKLDHERKIRQEIYRSRFLVLFIGIVLTLAIRPFLEGSIEAFLLSGFFFSYILLACIYSVSRTRGAFLFSLSLGLPSICAVWLGILLRDSSFHALGAILQVIFWSYILALILSHLLRVREVDADTIMGAACAYFLIGFAWSFIFFVLEFFSPGAFSFPHAAEHAGFNVFIYYSFVTLTTLGFGDITPVSDPARSLTILEAAIGQLFVAITISILVGSYLSRWGKRDSK